MLYIFIGVMDSPLVRLSTCVKANFHDSISAVSTPPVLSLEGLRMKRLWFHITQNKPNNPPNPT